MKTLIRALALLAVPGFLAINACKKDHNTTPTTPTTPPTALQSYISSDTSLSIYSALLARAGDASLVAGNDSVTVLVPTNDAFRMAGISESTVSSMSSTTADSLIRYHLINGSANLQNGAYGPFMTAGGTNVYGFGGGTDSNYFNGAQATKVAVTGSKGTVYRLNTPLSIPFGTGDAFFGADTSYSFLQSALTRAGIDLSTDTGFNTLLAPNNTAFRNAGYATLADITSADSAKLRRTLSYNILPGQYFTNSYNGMTSVGTSLAGTNVTIGTGANGTTFTGTGSNVTVGFAGPNQLVGSNAIYQPTNGVLMPSP